MSGEGIFALTGDCEAMDEYDKRQRIEAMTTPSPTVIEEARKMAADYSAMIYGERYREETLAGTRWVSLSEAFVAAIELGERRAEAAVVELELHVGELLACFNRKGQHIAPVQGGSPNQETAVANARAFLKRGDHRSNPA